MATRKGGQKGTRGGGRGAARKSATQRASKTQTLTLDPACPAGCELGRDKIMGGDQGRPRAELARARRRDAADDEFARLFGPPPGGTPPTHPCNGDEVLYRNQNFIASFTKGLPHDDATGEVRPAAYCDLLKALDTETGYESIMLGCDPNSRKLEDPQAGYAFDLEGADSHALEQPAPPRFASNDEAADILENYWLALARDIPFTDYANQPLLDAAYQDLRRFSFFTTPSPFYAVPGGITRANLFRGFAEGELIGPYVSQFLLLDVPYGAQSVSARIQTVLPRIDYMTTFREWLDVQNGCDANQSACDRVRRYIRNGRDLGQYVHVDLTFNAFLNAALILLSGRDPLRRCEALPGLGVPFAAGLPYVNASAPCAEEFPGKSKTQIGFATFGPTHVTGLLLEVMTRALKAVWYEKWLVHRRLRPEEFGGRAHREKTHPGTYPIAASLFQSPIFNPNGPYSVFQHNKAQNCNKRQDCKTMQPGDRDGTYLLPMAFAEGSPIHPSYGAGHATVAGACATILKAFFPEDQCISSPVVPNRTGTSLRPYEGDDRNQIRVGGEINKLAANISLGRNFAGMHWRSDHTESLKLGERVAISLLFDQRHTFHEDYYFKFRRFNGQPVQIDRHTTVAALRAWLNA
ncbi:MAG: vanadium-dependent haloperoxidase [Pyrinomonadaceae bacterium]